MFSPFSRMVVEGRLRRALLQVAVISIACGPPTAALAATGDGGGTTRFDLTLLVRIVVAVVLAFPIGWEREFRGSEAGDRTFMLVSLGAAAFTAVGVENFPATAEKIMAGVVTGVGFLGGGMILKDGGNVRGLTTAAAIWAASAVGMLAGIGELLIAALVTVLVILILELQFLPVIGRLDARRWRPKDASRDSNGNEF
ncbi:MgtC family protein [Rhodopseudomonas boonkerdii]|uniref:MgtC/SapB family protein n=1 Tax=Rhodopseudomonas boonkerdii TaxID=475937 RepID=UPI001E415E11|nr:MgtC/SapB family protein [Rhodopseudomonas boonkerdii]UGV24669.1 MgtC family protein [Rhodopseudomonas boonkerdii]